VRAAIFGNVNATLTPAAIIAAHGALAGSIDAITSFDGSLRGVAPIFGTTEIAVTSTGDIIGSLLLGHIQIGVTLDGYLSDQGALAGTTAIGLTAVGTMQEGIGGIVRCIGLLLVWTEAEGVRFNPNGQGTLTLDDERFNELTLDDERVNRLTVNEDRVNRLELVEV
jgi:hypothetical protein